MLEHQRRLEGMASETYCHILLGSRSTPYYLKPHVLSIDSSSVQSPRDSVMTGFEAWVCIRLYCNNDKYPDCIETNSLGMKRRSRTERPRRFQALIDCSCSPLSLRRQSNHLLSLCHRSLSKSLVLSRRALLSDARVHALARAENFFVRTWRCGRAKRLNSSSLKYVPLLISSRPFLIRASSRLVGRYGETSIAA